MGRDGFIIASLPVLLLRPCFFMWRNAGGCGRINGHSDSSVIAL